MPKFTIMSFTHGGLIPGWSVSNYERPIVGAVRRFAPGPDSSTAPAGRMAHGRADSGIREVQTDAW
jgi:hypothetical protein